MRFMMLVIPGGKEPPGAPPDPKFVETMARYNQELQKAGVLLALDGLQPQATGFRVHFANGKPLVTDGPFTESKEVICGYWMIQVKSRAEAVEWARRIPGSEDMIVEVRQCAS